MDNGCWKFSPPVGCLEMWWREEVKKCSNVFYFNSHSGHHVPFESGPVVFASIVFWNFHPLHSSKLTKLAGKSTKLKMYLPTKNGGFSIAMKDEAILPTSESPGHCAKMVVHGATTFYSGETFEHIGCKVWSKSQICIAHRCPQF